MNVIKDSIKKRCNSIIKRLFVACAAACVVYSCAGISCYAVQSTTLAKGLKSLISDLTTWLLVIIPIAGGLYMLITWLKQMGESDEMDEKPHKKKIKSIFFVIIAAECASGLINVLVNNYFKG